jgi:RimJ/RimL family protein N-acetyltransferase
MTILTTPRLIMRRARASDVDDMHRVLSDPAALDYWSSGPHTSRDETVAWIDAMIASPPAESDDFVIEYQGTVIGKLGTWRLPEIGYIIAPAYWGRGLASEALRAFLPHVFARPDVDRLIADVDPRNLRSLAMLERHGFVRTGYASGTWHTHTGIADSVYLELRRVAYAPGN